jgi:hypothetical protein
MQIHPCRNMSWNSTEGGNRPITEVALVALAPRQRERLVPFFPREIFLYLSLVFGQRRDNRMDYKNLGLGWEKESCFQYSHIDLGFGCYLSFLFSDSLEEHRGA